MVAKIECDRCEEQWCADDKLKALCTGNVMIPGHRLRTWDLCKPCAEKVIELIESPMGKAR